MLGKLKKIFIKRSEEGVGESKAIIPTPAHAEIKVKPVDLKPKQKTYKKRRHVMFTSGVERDNFIGAVVDTRTINKKNVKHPNVNIIVVFMKNGITLRKPEMKWINDSLCVTVDEKSTGTIEQYFDIVLWDVLSCSLN